MHGERLSLHLNADSPKAVELPGGKPGDRELSSRFSQVAMEVGRGSRQAEQKTG
jgi:hypothetical protein